MKCSVMLTFMLLCTYLTHAAIDPSITDNFDDLGAGFAPRVAFCVCKCGPYGGKRYAFMFGSEREKEKMIRRIRERAKRDCCGCAHDPVVLDTALFPFPFQKKRTNK